ncbi:hypothetical protein [Mycolicibacterium brisbanense]
MSDNKETETEKDGAGLAPGDVTDFIVVLMQHDKGRAQHEASKGLAECVDAALATGKKGGKVTVEMGVEPLESGAVKLEVTVKSAPKKEPAGSIWFTDGEGHLSRDNAGMFYGLK